MKTKQLFIVLSICCASLMAPITRAVDITATNSGNWGDPTIWQGGSVPGTNDDADIQSGITVTVTTNTEVQYIYDAGTVTLSPNATLTITDPSGGMGTASLGTLNATAAGCTVIYNCNPYWTKLCDYYNLVFDTSYWIPPTNIPPWLDFNNFSTFQGSVPMNIAGDMTLVGHVKVQQGSDTSGNSCDIYIGGDLIIGQGCAWDCSGANLTVVSNTYVYGKLLDGNAALGSNYFGGNLLVLGPATPGRAYYQPPFYIGDYTNGWFVSDVTQWAIGGNLTNNGYIGGGTNYGSVAFDGTGVIAGSNVITMPTMTINGTYEIADTIILTTNYPTINGTEVFDTCNTNGLITLNSGTNWFWYSTNGTLVVTNSCGEPFVAGETFQLFSNLGNSNYGGNFASIFLPTLPAGFSWGPASALATNYLPTGSITVIGPPGRPILYISRSGANIILSWDTATFPGYSVLAKTNRAGVSGGSWVDAGSGGVSPFTVPDNPTNTVFFRLSHP